jgi:hypothetical protein
MVCLKHQLTGEIRKYVSGMTNEVELGGFGRKSGINTEWDGRELRFGRNSGINEWWHKRMDGKGPVSLI